MFSDILIPKPLVGGFKRGVGLMGESGGLGEGEGLIAGMVSAGREGVWLSLAKVKMALNIY